MELEDVLRLAYMLARIAEWAESALKTRRARHRRR